MAGYVEGKKQSLFGDSKTDHNTPEKATENRMFISGDLSSYNLPEEFLKEKKQMPYFWKGFLFTVSCGFLFIIMTLLLALSLDEGEASDNPPNRFFVSEGVETNISHSLDIDKDIDCYEIDINIITNEPNTEIYTQCWGNDPEITNSGIIPLKMYERNIEIGILDFNASSIEVILPITFSNNSNISFIMDSWNYPTKKSTFMVNNSDSGSTFLVYLPEYTQADELNFRIEITTSEGISEYSEWVNQGNDCWYYGSKCTFNIGMESEIGFIDYKSQILVISLEQPFTKGSYLEIEYHDWYDGDDEIIFLFLWIPPIIFAIGVIMMVYNKNMLMVGGASAGIIPVVILTSIISVFIFEGIL